MSGERKWNERPIPHPSELTDNKGAPLCETEGLFRLLFQNSADAIMIVDPQTGMCIDCNEAAVRMVRGGTKEWLISQSLASLSPPRQPDGSVSADRITEVIRRTSDEGSQRLEWVARGRDGDEFPIEVLATTVEMAGRRLVVMVSREISERKKAEARIQQHNQELEARVRERTLELVQANEQLKGEIKERRRKEKIQKAIYQLSEAIHTAEDLESLYRQIHVIIKGLMAASNFYLALRDPLTGLHHYGYHVDEVDPKPAPRLMKTGMNGYVLRTGKALLADRAAMSRPKPPGAVEDDQSWYREAGTPSAIWLGVPLTIQGETLGVMTVQDYHDEKAYGEEEKQILAFIGEQTALAIQRKRSDQTMRESEHKFRALFEASSHGVMLHDEEKFLEVNPATVRILGFDRADQIIGRHPAEMAAPVQPSGEKADVLARSHIEECMRNGSARFDWLCRNPKGVEIPIEVMLTRIEMGGRHIIQAVIHDISERKKAESELIKALAREKELSEMKSNFATMVSHEFRTPLGVIMSSSDILSLYLERLEPEERQEHLQSIHKNVRRMANLMEEVLLLGMVEAGKMNFKPSPLALASFCLRLTDELLSATDRKCPILFESRGLPEESIADERLLRHILTNLITNAVKYSAPGSPVHFEAAREGAELVWRIRDRGIGIPELDVAWLFKAFHRGRNVGHVPGTGLGLVIVKRCVELHHGHITIESTVGQGTTATVRLPLLTAEL